jgi:uncharacterized membrane protein YfhO
MIVPAGDHTIEFTFAPKSFNKIENISVIALIGLILLIVVSAGYGIMQLKKKDQAKK